MDEVVYASYVHRPDGVQIRQHVQGFYVVVAFHHRDECSTSAARQADVRQGLRCVTPEGSIKVPHGDGHSNDGRYKMRLRVRRSRHASTKRSKREGWMHSPFFFHAVNVKHRSSSTYAVHVQRSPTHNERTACPPGSTYRRPLFPRLSPLFDKFRFCCAYLHGILCVGRV